MKDRFIQLYSRHTFYCDCVKLCDQIHSNAALTYTEYPLRILKFEIRAEITEYDANGRGGACTKRCLCESDKNACGSLQIS